MSTKYTAEKASVKESAWIEENVKIREEVKGLKARVPTIENSRACEEDVTDRVTWFADNITCHRYLRCNRNPIRLFHLSTPLPISSPRSSSFLRAIMNLLTPSLTIPYYVLGSDVVTLRSPLILNTRISFATQSVHSFSLPPRVRYPASSNFPAMIRLCNLWSPMRVSAPARSILPVSTVVSILLHPTRWRKSLCERIRSSSD